MSSDECEFDENEVFNPVTGSIDSPQTAGDDMTEEEKIAESERLLELFERLERNGIIRVMTTNDTNNPNTS